MRYGQQCVHLRQPERIAQTALRQIPHHGDRQHDLVGREPQQDVYKRQGIIRKIMIQIPKRFCDLCSLITRSLHQLYIGGILAILQ